MTYHVLLTGHEGYVGNKLQEELLKREVIVGTFEGDLLDIDWENKQKQFDMVVHLAGLAGVRRSFREPEEYYKNNVELSRKIFKYCERTRTEVMYASSSNAHEWWLNPYATTKQMIEEELKLSNEVAGEVLDSLVRDGLIEFSRNKFIVINDN